MRSEPRIRLPELARFLGERYDLQVERLEFVPIGLDSWSYVATERGARRVFLKLFPPGGTPAGAERGHELPLVAALADLGTVAVPRPVPDRNGRFVNAFGPFPLYVLDYVEGRNLEDEEVWPETLYATVARALAGIHAATERVGRHATRVERFEVPFLDALAGRVSALQQRSPFPASAPGALAALRDLLVPHASQLRQHIARFEQLREIARKRDGRRVLCHTDFWGSNLLLDADGRLWVVDWDGALLAPPECDLFMFAATSFFSAARFGSFLDDYEPAFGPTTLDADVLGFYAYRRVLEDLASFVETLARPRADGVPASDALRFASSALSDLELLEPRIAAAHELLRNRRRA